MDNLEAPILLSPKEIKTENFELEYNKELYSIQISTKNDNINLIVSRKNIISDQFYENSFPLKQLFSLSKIFRLCDNVDDVLEMLTPNMKQAKILIEEKNFYLCFTFDLPSNKRETVKFPLNSNKFDDSQVINKLCDKIISIEEKNKNLEEKVKNLESEVNCLKEKVKNTNIKSLCE